MVRLFQEPQPNDRLDPCRSQKSSSSLSPDPSYYAKLQGRLISFNLGMSQLLSEINQPVKNARNERSLLRHSLVVRRLASNSMCLIRSVVRQSRFFSVY
jgi:hypothetical protein